VDDSFPGPKTRAALERGIPLFKNGLRFDAEMDRAGQRGFRPVRQIVIDKAEGDFVWDLDGKRYIDFQNGWATNPLGNCDPEILEAVEAANRRFGFHYDHPLRYELAEMLADIMPGKALPRTNYEVSGAELLGMTPRSGIKGMIVVIALYAVAMVAVSWPVYRYLVRK